MQSLVDAPIHGLPAIVVGAALAAPWVTYGLWRLWDRRALRCGEHAPGRHAGELRVEEIEQRVRAEAPEPAWPVGTALDAAVVAEAFEDEVLPEVRERPYVTHELARRAALVQLAAPENVISEPESAIPVQPCPAERSQNNLPVVTKAAS